jgi:Putative zinc dependent peptidase (DUF5700)
MSRTTKASIEESTGRPAGTAVVARGLLRAAVFCVAFGPAAVLCAAQSHAAPSALDVRLVADEAEAALAVLAKRRAGLPVGEEDWRRVFSSEGYVRLKRREESMRRSFEDADFRAFLLSDQMLARSQALEETLARWKRADVAAAARLALAYLPAGARIRAKIYPVVKPRDNSFVFDLGTDPAIFLYLDPEKSAAQFQNTLAHELHHIGFAGSCPPPRAAGETAAWPANTRRALRLVGAFGEGFAMLAAAGGPRAHPHAASPAADRARWDRDVSNFNADLEKVAAFFRDILAGRLSDEEAQRVSASFYGVQGPWYTVGWKMSVVIEETYGRAALVESMCDQRKLLQTYNRAAGRHKRRGRAPLALWPRSLVRSLARGRP